MVEIFTGILKIILIGLKTGRNMIQPSEIPLVAIIYTFVILLATHIFIENKNKKAQKVCFFILLILAPWVLYRILRKDD